MRLKRFSGIKPERNEPEDDKYCGSLEQDDGDLQENRGVVAVIDFFTDCSQFGCRERRRIDMHAYLMILLRCVSAQI